MALRDPNGSVGFSWWWSRPDVEFVGRPGAPFGGRDAEPGPVAAVFGRLAALLGLLAALLGYLATSLGYLASLLGVLAA